MQVFAGLPWTRNVKRPSCQQCPFSVLSLAMSSKISEKPALLYIDTEYLFGFPLIPVCNKSVGSLDGGFSNYGNKKIN